MTYLPSAILTQFSDRVHQRLDVDGGDKVGMCYNDKVVESVHSKLCTHPRNGRSHGRPIQRENIDSDQSDMRRQYIRHHPTRSVHCQVHVHYSVHDPRICHIRTTTTYSNAEHHIASVIS